MSVISREAASCRSRGRSLINLTHCEELPRCFWQLKNPTPERGGGVVSAETVRRWLHELGWEWKRAKVVAKDDDPQRVEKLARIRYAFEQLRAGAALFFADELDISLLPKVGYQWLPTGAQLPGFSANNAPLRDHQKAPQTRPGAGVPAGARGQSAR
jgi:Winged helix-turn helix